jgi:hypothetical protein
MIRNRHPIDRGRTSNTFILKRNKKDMQNKQKPLISGKRDFVNGKIFIQNIIFQKLNAYLLAPV